MTTVSRLAILLAGVVFYFLGVAALVAWITSMLGVLPFTGGPVALTGVAAFVFNLGLMLAFGVQHSVMARAAFKERWTRLIPAGFDRHPIMTGALIGMWVTPTMQLDHLLFASFGTLYIIVGVYFEERALLREWGPTYEDYRNRVASIVPTLARS